MKKRPYGKYTPEQESGSSEETESAARRESLRDLARQGIIIADYMQQRRWDRQRERRRRQRRQYFLKQRLTGVFLLVFTALAVMATGGDATIAIITVPLGLYLVFTKEMIL